MTPTETRKNIERQYEMLVDTGGVSKDTTGLSCRHGDAVFFMGGDPQGTGVQQIPLRGSVSHPGQTPDWPGLHRYIYLKRADIQWVLGSALPYTVTAATAGQDVPPLLDDFAQIVGVSARVIQKSADEAVFFKRVLQGMKRRNAVLIPEQGGLCAAKSFDDVLAAAQVLEKNCRALVEGAFLGGGFRIGLFQAWLMRLVYRYKYSNKTA
ncbi:MAG: class II aldolase/adducin family protein [Myxococcota bacterium]|nr:class II aldolase/adducin family protein [Myxococcota bacterium]